MQQHKKISKQLHGQIKKDKKTIELFKEKIAKLILEKKKLEENNNLKVIQTNWTLLKFNF